LFPGSLSSTSLIVERKTLVAADHVTTQVWVIKKSFGYQGSKSTFGKNIAEFRSQKKIRSQMEHKLFDG